jgi:hypothetical protein
VHKVSALIPYKPDNGRRDFLWSFVQIRYQQFLPDVELCVGLDDSELFCRARAINEAAKQASGDIFIIVDIDVIFDPSLLRRIIDIIDSHSWIIPFSRAYRLNQAATDHLIEAGLPETFTIAQEDVEYDQIVLGGYMNVMPRNAFEAVGGLDERFKGYGFEDISLAISLDTIRGPHYRMEEIIYHLWHPWVEFYHANYTKSHRLYQRYIAASGNVKVIKNLIKERS